MWNILSLTGDNFNNCNKQLSLRCSSVYVNDVYIKLMPIIITANICI